MEHSLLCANQVREFGIKVDDRPKEYDWSNEGYSHSICVQVPNVMLSLERYGPTSLWARG